MFRKAILQDVDTITEIYESIHTEEEAGRTTIGWIRDIYPTRQTAVDSVLKGDMFVEEINGQIVAAAKINQEQVPEYADATWQYDALPEQVMVLHTLVVDPKEKGKGYGTKFVKYYEEYALFHGCPYLRMDTNEKNSQARTLYKKLGYEEVSTVSCIFNGIPDVRLICLEKKV